MKLQICLLFVLLGACSALPTKTSKPRSYEGYKVLRISAKGEDQLRTLLWLREQLETAPEENDAVQLVNFWTEPSATGPSDLMVAQEALGKVQSILKLAGISFEVFIEDVGRLVQDQLEQNAAALAINQNEGRMDWTAYHRYDEIMAWLNQLALNYTIANVEIIGRSGGGRDLRLIKISNDGGLQPNKSAIFIDGAFHAREWISPAVTTYIINQLVTNSSAYADILEKLDFYILPITNPDGYEFTHTDQRMWRKTRSPIPGSTCLGVDPNRNFNVDFGGSGSSTNPCAETYLGDRPFSELETEFLSQYLANNAHKFRAYLSMHSYSQAWLTPFAWSASPPPNFNEIMNVGQKAIDALRNVYGTRYVVGPTSTTLYFHSGASQDWAKTNAGIKYTYTVELRDTGTYGFLLPPNQILPTSVETWEAVQVVAREIINEMK